MSSSQLYRNQQADTQRLYNGFPLQTQKSNANSSSNLNGSSSSGRPTSAGATRSSRNNNFSYGQPSSSNNSGRSNTGTTNIFAAQNNQPVSTTGLLVGQGYSNQRPSSAGHSRGNSSSGNNGNNVNVTSHLNTGNPIPISQLMGSYPNHGGVVNSNPMSGGGSNSGGSSSGRPKSASAARRTNDPSQQSQQNQINMANIYGASSNMTVQQIYNLQQQQQAQQLAMQQHQYKLQQQQQLAEQQAAQQQHGSYHYNTTGHSQPTQRPLSANATSHTSTRNVDSAQYADHWSNSYKLHYAYNNGQQQNGQTHAPGVPGSTQQQASQQSGKPAPQLGNPPNSLQYTNIPVDNSRPASAAAVVKLRSAVDLSHRINDGTAAIPAVQGISGAAPVVQLTGLDNDEGDADLNLDGLALNTEANAGTSARNAGGGGKILLRDEDDDEMDGKPIYDSRSHPEVSLTTPSASLELGNSSTGLNGGHTLVMDVRNTSLDSFSEDNIVVGLSTVPNQFCTKRDALELKKLLVLSAGTRGGIVPSSSAVMDMYMVGKVVGVGSYGKVRAAWHRLTSSKVAIKTYDKSKLKDPAHWKRVHSEIKIMEQISHPRIARMYEAVETPKRMHLIMECLDGGNLCSYVKAKRRLSEDESRRIFFQILQAIEHLHALGVSHRDVKLENVLFADDKDIKLIDFGFSTVCQPGKKLKVFCGTPSYMAPEIVRRAEYEGKPVDIWSLGILLYALLCGCFPFRAKAYPDLYRRIARGTFPIPDELSAPVKDLLRQLLTVDADTRITAHAAMRHPWLQVQLINAPNIDKMRQETTILISDKPADDLDDQVLSELEKFGMTKEEVVRLVLTKTHSSLATLYYLLLDTLVSKRRAAAKRTGGHGHGVITGPHQVIHLNSSGNAQPQRPKSASAGSGGGHGINFSAGNMAVGAGVQIKPQHVQMMTIQQQQQQQQQMELQQQQLLAEQQAAQQQLINDRQEYRYRPKSAAMARSGSSNGQRPNSAFATRR